MAEEATSRPFRIILPSGTPLFGITRTKYLLNNGVVKPSPSQTPEGTIKGSNVYYYIETTLSDYQNVSEFQRLRYSDPTGGVGAPPKYYKLVALYNSSFNSQNKWIPTSETGAELQKEIANFNRGTRNQMSTVLATAPKAVAQAARVSESGLAATLFANNVAPTPPQNPNQSGNPSGSSPTPPGSSEPGGNTPPPPPSDLEVTFDTNYKTDLRVEKSLFEGKILRYPIDIASTEQDVISFTACEINPRTPKNLGTDNKVNLEFNFGEKTYTKASGSVFLSIQAPISDQNSVEWGGDNVNPIDAALYGASLNFMGAQFEEFGQYIQGYTKSTFDALKGESKRFQKYLAGQAANINNVLARTDNVILNPNMELLFNGPQLRPFSFTFKMSARKQEEATEIKNIIKFFKFHMAVRKEVNSLFIRAPYVFKIKYEQRKGNQNTIHSGLNLIKMCALTNFSVDYTPLGSYATYRDGTMVAYNMTMQFQELTPVYNDDYTDFEYGDGEKISNPIIGP